MWCVMCDARCVMFQTWFFVRSWLYESRGDQKYPIWVISDLLSDIPKLIPGGSRMYTISCKASHTNKKQIGNPLHCSIGQNIWKHWGTMWNNYKTSRNWLHERQSPTWRSRRQDLIFICIALCRSVLEIWSQMSNLCL